MESLRELAYTVLHGNAHPSTWNPGLLNTLDLIRKLQVEPADTLLERIDHWERVLDMLDSELLERALL